MPPVDDESVKKAVAKAKERIQGDKVSNKSHYNLSLDRDNYQKLQKKVGRGNVSATLDLVIKYLLEELED